MLESPEIDDVRMNALLQLAKDGSRRLARRQRRRRSVAGLAALALVLAVAGAIVVRPNDGATTHHQATDSTTRSGHVRPLSPMWRLVGDVTQAWQASPLAGSEPHYGLVCPSATTCYTQELDINGAGSGMPPTLIEITHDGGSTWQQSTLLAGDAMTTSLDCIDADTCSGGGYDSAGNDVYLATTDGGATWTSLPGPSQLPTSFAFAAISCTTAESCVALGSVSGADGTSDTPYSLVTTDGGETWSDSVLRAGFVANLLECTAAGCVAAGFQQPADPSVPGVAGEMFSSNDGGATWSAATLPSGIGPIQAVSCSDETDCTAVTFGGKGPEAAPSKVLVTTDAGVTWTAAAADGLPGSLLQGLSCPTTSYCWAGGLLLPAKQDGSAGAIAIADLDGVLATTSDGGATWQTAPVPGGVGHTLVTAVSCPSQTTCMALAAVPDASGTLSFELLSYSAGT